MEPNPTLHIPSTPPPVPERPKGEKVERKSKPPPLTPEQIAESKFSKVERARRSRAAWDADKAAEACSRLENIVLHRMIDRGGERSAGAMEGIAVREMMMDGEPIGSKPVGEPGVNVTEVLSLLDTRNEGILRAISKPASGEKTFSYDPETKEHFVVSKRTKALGEMERTKSKPSDKIEQERSLLLKAGHSPEVVEETLAQRRSMLRNEAAKIAQDTEEFPSFARALAKEYGVDEKTIAGMYLEEVGMTPKEIEDLWFMGEDVYEKTIKEKLELTYRKGQPPGWGHTREFVFSQVDKLFGFDVVPETVLKVARDKTGKTQEVMSLQQMGQAREMTDDELMALGKLEASDPRAKQLMRIAALDYLLGTTDRHAGNILVDKATGSLIAIDNAYSQGFRNPGTTKDLREAGILQEGQSAMPDPHVSIAMEFAEHTQFELDEEALAGVRDFYEKTSMYLSERPKYKILSEKYEKARESMSPDDLALYQKMETVGEYPKYMTDLFRLSFRSDGKDPDREKIIQSELAGFVEGCAYLMKYKKLPAAQPMSAFGGLRPVMGGDWAEQKSTSTGEAPNPFAAAA